MARIVLLLALVGAIGIPSVSAQSAPPEQGDTVRLIVRHPTYRTDTRIVGVFDSLGQDSLYTVDTAYARPLVRSIEVARGQRRWTLEGAVAGFALGALAGSLSGAAADQRDLPQQGEPARWWRAGLIGAGIGTAVGLGIGSLFQTTRWEVYSLVAGDGGGLSVRLSLPVR